MNRVLNKIFLVILSTLFTCGITLAINSEFKNSLLKIELIKSSDNAYNVDLYIKNKFNEPVKIIKKSDLNYYILLPETKNESVRTTTKGSDIRNVSTNVYPYAGQDVHNGYVKININTTKPLNFRVNIKDTLADSKNIQQKSTTVAKANNQPEQKKVQKKNSVSSISNPQKQLKKQENVKKVELKKPINKKQIVENKKPQIVSVETNQKVNKEDNSDKILNAVKEEIKKAREEKRQNLENTENLENLENIEQAKIIEPSFDGIEQLLTKKDIETVEQIEQQDKLVQEDNSESMGAFSRIKRKVASELLPYGISLKDLLIMTIAFLFSFFFMLAILNKKPSQTKLKRKSDIIGSSRSKYFKNTNKNDGKYFVFDKNIRQTGFCDPATSAVRKNYELSSYEPELNQDYDRHKTYVKKDESENNQYDIIQKILKEDDVMDIPVQNPIEEEVMIGLKQDMPRYVAKKSSIEVKQEQKQEIKKQTKQIVKKEPVKEVKKEVKVQQEPTVLSSVEIAPERGFMCVSYNDNINLIGYIFDDVFALYNFKTPKLENYEIQYRLSEKDLENTYFIVKIADKKLLISVSNSNMKLEVLI